MSESDRKARRFPISRHASGGAANSLGGRGHLLVVHHTLRKLTRDALERRWVHRRPEPEHLCPNCKKRDFSRKPGKGSVCGHKVPHKGWNRCQSCAEVQGKCAACGTRLDAENS